MPRRPMRVTDAERAPLATALRELRARTHVPGGFPPAVLEEAERAARRPRMPAYDATDVPLFTIDPPGSTDLDQAMYLARRDAGGFRVYYAIADVGAFVAPGGALDREAHERVVTLYYPDLRVPLHPPVLGEGAASLLPDHDRPAVLWRLDLDADGNVERTDVRRAVVRSRARLDYAGVQRALDSGTAEEPLSLLREVGRLREGLERTRGGVSLNVPEQEVVRRADGRYALEYRAPLPAEGWNAQISLMTGTAAAQLMLTAGTGVLRTLPAAPESAVARLRRVARALGVTWPEAMPYAVVVRALDPRHPQHAAFLQECTALLRGAGYAAFDRDRPSELPPPAAPVHAALAAPYAHCTAPLRRLVDRYTSELCLAAVAGTAAPEWVRAALDALPAEMERGGRRAGEAERECVDLVEAALLRDRIGEVFDGYVVDVVESRPTAGRVHLYDPAVIGHVEGDGDGPPLPLGRRMRVRVIEANPGREKVWFAPA
ncbi:ribonuclease II [Streptomyces cinnamoneus]|uniref:Ribonuclease II n=1 Tax=Streptomyces cinnamoneus TaxID=53446 RepID=A0A2G1XGT4_STRCJ|nr:RNB domain-containing ribonuclease [Streptomyces cinnamoneus]PHQ50425.1 ribonuclease II [Streptomyces cinnamoneus]PPT16431.1 RNB domain-containing ribonuclease [Streptomyces cinnamoneus]